MMSETYASSGKNALVVEDHQQSAELLKMILELEDWRVECVETGSEALRVLTEHSTSEAMSFDPDVMILDLRLPDMRGAELIERLRERQAKIPPTVILSADSAVALSETASKTGLTVVRKPFEFEELFSAIANALT